LILNLQGYDIKLDNPPKDEKLIYGYDKPKSEQVWERPYHYTDETFNKLSSYYKDEIKKQEIERRVLGFWFMLNGKPTYLTGDAYFYFTHFTIDGQHPLYIHHQAEDFYFYKHCEEDPYCEGVIIIKPRQEGSTSRFQSLYLNQGTLEFNVHYGIQSKSGDDAEKVNFDKLVTSFSYLPEWMKPNLQGTAFPPHEELRFGKPRVTKKNDEAKTFLNTVIDWKSTVFNAYDGKKLKKWIGDEYLKFPKTCSFDDTWKVVRPALRKANGMAYILSTMGEVNEEAGDVGRKLWKDSDPNKRTENGKTTSGLYRWFVPNWRAYFHETYKGKPLIDKFGFIDIENAKKFIKNEYDSKETVKDKFFFVRQNPANVEEALNYGSSSNVFDTIRISKRLNEIEKFEPTQERAKPYLNGNLYWKDNIRFGQVVFKESKDGESGKWNISDFPQLAGFDKINNVFRKDGKIKHFANTPFLAGVDPFSYDNKDGKGFSLGAILVRLNSNMYANDRSNRYCCEYMFRETLSEMFYEDVALTLFFYGAKLNFERSAYSTGLEKFLKKHGLVGFAMRRPDVTKKTAFTMRDNELGTPASEENIALGIRYIENYVSEPNPLINEHEIDYLDNFWFDRTLKQLMDYSITNKTKFDLVAAMIQCEIGCQPDKKVSEAAKDHVKNMEEVYRYLFNIKAPQSQIRELS
jgi:hypothetical protein